MGNGKPPCENGESRGFKTFGFGFPYGNNQTKTVSSKSPYGNGIQSITAPVSILGSPKGNQYHFKKPF
jgi:hypothetical protein